MDVPELLDMPELNAIGPVHEEMHLAARNLLLMSRDGLDIPAEEYDRLSNFTQELRRQLGELSNRFKGDLGLASRLMGKVFESASEGVIITDPEATILNVNRAFTQVTGYRPEEPLGKTPHLLSSGRQDQAFYQDMWNTFIEQGQWQGNIWNRRKDGASYLEHLSIVAVRDEHGRPYRMVGTNSDNTARKNPEDALFAEKERAQGTPHPIRDAGTTNGRPEQRRVGREVSQRAGPRPG